MRGERRLTAKVLEAIRVDREENGFTLSRIMERHGLPRTTAYSAIAGMDASKVQRAAPTRRVVQFERPPRPPSRKPILVRPHARSSPRA